MYPFFRKSVSSFIDIKDEEKWVAFEKLLVPETVKKKQLLLREGSICKKMAFVESGVFRQYYLVEGEEITNQFIYEGQFTGSYASFLNQSASHFYIEALEDSKILQLTLEDFKLLLSEHEVWKDFVLKYIEALFFQKEEREVSFLKDSPEARYANFLNEHPLLLNRVPLKLIASYLNMTPETISRIRSKFSEK